MSPHCTSWISASRGFRDHYPRSTGLPMPGMTSETREGVHRGGGCRSQGMEDVSGTWAQSEQGYPP